MTLSLARGIRRPQSKELLATDVMTTNPKSIGYNKSARDIAWFLATYGIHTAPVIDEAGRPIGVVSRTDLLDYWGRRRDRLAALASGEALLDTCDLGPGDDVADLTVMQIMTPVVFCVSVDAPIATVIEKILALEVRCLFVTDEHGVLVGALSIYDLLRSVAGLAGHTRSVRQWTL